MPERLAVPRYCQLCGGYLVERFLAEEGRARFRCELCGFIHYVNPRVVAGLIVEHGGRVLLQQRAIDPGRGLWTFPGGFLEIGETPEEGALRETREETGLTAEVEALHGVYARPAAGIVLVVYRATSASDAAVVGDAESQAVAWYTPEALPWDALAFETTARALRDWVRGPRGVGV